MRTLSRSFHDFIATHFGLWLLLFVIGSLLWAFHLIDFKNLFYGTYYSGLTLGLHWLFNK